eukprot:Rmarinus@m.18932
MSLLRSLAARVQSTSPVLGAALLENSLGVGCASCQIRCVSYYKLLLKRKRERGRRIAREEYEKLQRGEKVGTEEWPWPRFTLSGTRIGRRLRAPRKRYPKEIDWRAVSWPRGEELEYNRQKRIYELQVHELRKQYQKEADATYEREKAIVKAAALRRKVELAKEIIHEKQRELLKLLARDKDVEARKQHNKAMSRIKHELHVRREMQRRSRQKAFATSLSKGSDTYVTEENLDDVVDAMLLHPREFSSRALYVKDDLDRGIPEELRDLLRLVQDPLPTDGPVFGRVPVPEKSSGSPSNVSGPNSERRAASVGAGAAGTGATAEKSS